MFVEEWKKISHEIRKQEVREASYSVATVENEKLFQIQTYGPNGVQAGAKQIIQFNKQQALELVKILINEFC